MRRGGRMFGLHRNPMASTIERNASYSSADSATYGGVVLRATIMVAIMLVVGGFMFQSIVATEMISGTQVGLLIGGMIVGLISVIVGVRSLRLSQFFSLLYATAQGFVLGIISGMYEVAFGDGIVITAVAATAGVVTAMLFLYRSGVIKVTERFRSIMFSLLIGYFFFLIFMMILSFFGMNFLQTGNLGFMLIISVAATVLATLMLLIDFDNITKMVENNVDRRYEWVLALSLMVTIVWLYIEILRLLAILALRNRN